MDRFGFKPDGVRAERLDQLVREGLADSLETIFASLEPPRGGDDRLAELLRLIRAGPVSPGLFGAYVELVLAIFDGRDADAESLVQELAGWRPAAVGDLRMVTLADCDLGRGQGERYRRMLSDDIPGTIEPLAASGRAHAEVQLTRALELLQAGAPDLFDEIRRLTREIVLVAARNLPDGTTFEGASTFSLWGALVLNADRLGDRLEVATSLAHEAAHTHLFGLALGGRLTENDGGERYASPLRQDPRPMEGVAHAVYVTARMVYALETLIASGRLTADEIARARGQLRRNEAAFDRGLATVSAHAAMTPSGAAAFSALRRYREGRREAAWA